MHIGRFKVSGNFLRTDPEALIQLQHGMAVVHTESHAYSDTIEFTAIGLMFPFVPDGQVIPLYDFSVSVDDDGNQSYSIRQIKG